MCVAVRCLMLFPHGVSSFTVLSVSPQDHNFLEVVNLRPASSYRLEVQVITSAGEGPATMKVFHTPSVTSALHHSKLLHTHTG